MNRVLMIAFEFPPCHSAGVQRTVSFVRHLPGLDWQPVVLTANIAAYRHIDNSCVDRWPPDVEIARAFALDSSRHLAIGGRYLSITASPDRYVSWFGPAVMRGLGLVRRFRPRVIWSTYPVATSHLIAGTLSRRTGIPWVADYRDPARFLYDDRAARSRFARRVDSRTVREARMLVFTTGKAQGLYLKHYPDLDSARTAVIENGFDGDGFAHTANAASQPFDAAGPEVLLLHSGALYEQGRDPSGLIEATGILGKRLSAEGRRLCLRFRGAKSTEKQCQLVRQYGAEAYVEFAPRTSFEEAQREMFRANVLVLLQSELFDLQIPGKVYEYIAARRPIVALTSAAGATAELLCDIESSVVVCNDDVAGIVDGLQRALEMDRRGGDLKRFDRAAGARRLAEILSAAADFDQPARTSNAAG